MWETKYSGKFGKEIGFLLKVQAFCHEVEQVQVRWITTDMMLSEIFKY
jgi:hypothetical protein